MERALLWTKLGIALFSLEFFTEGKSKGKSSLNFSSGFLTSEALKLLKQVRGKCCCSMQYARLNHHDPAVSSLFTAFSLPYFLILLYCCVGQQLLCKLSSGFSSASFCPVSTDDVTLLLIESVWALRCQSPLLVCLIMQRVACPSPPFVSSPIVTKRPLFPLIEIMNHS